jgi:dihydrofolate reductase
MSKVRVHIAVSADGYVAGPNQSEENPLGEGGESLHDWVVALRAWREPHGREGGEVNASTPVVEEAQANVGAEIMGRGKFGGGPGPWGDDPWPGWWGEDPPFHMPVFVLTHHEREPLTLSDTTFTFVTDGIESALEQAGRQPPERTSRSAVAPLSSTNIWWPGSSTSSSCTSTGAGRRRAAVRGASAQT